MITVPFGRLLIPSTISLNTIHTNTIWRVILQECLAGSGSDTSISFDGGVLQAVLADWEYCLQIFSQDVEKCPSVTSKGSDVLT